MNIFVHSRHLYTFLYIHLCSLGPYAPPKFWFGNIAERVRRNLRFEWVQFACQAMIGEVGRWVQLDEFRTCAACAILCGFWLELLQKSAHCKSCADGGAGGGPASGSKVYVGNLPSDISKDAPFPGSHTVTKQSQNYRYVQYCITYQLLPCASMYCIMFACREEDYSLLDDLPLDLSAESAEVLQQVFTTYGQRPQPICFEHRRFMQIQTICLTVSKGCGRHPYNDRKAPRKGSENCKQVMRSILDFLIFLAFLSMSRWSLTDFIRRSKSGQASAFIKYFGAGEASDFGIGNQRASEGAEQHCMKLVKLLPVSRLLTR